MHGKKGSASLSTSTDMKKIREKEAELIKLKNKVKAQNSSKSKEPSEGAELEKDVESNTAAEPEDRTSHLVKTLEMARGKRLLICIKGYPDPDNIATSLALSHMCSGFEIQSTIVHFDQISHHENRALVKKLDLDIEEYSEQFDYTSYDYFAINDSQNTELPIKIPETCELLVFVDHHKKLGSVKGHFVDIRETAGSTSAIYGEYLTDSRFGFSGDSMEGSRIATALMHGIRSDTDNFVNAMPIDYKASEFLSKFVDKDLLSLISRQSIPAKTMDLTQIALQRKDIRGTFMFSGVGYVREEDRDGIGQCADYLLNREGIDTVVVYGVVGGEFVDGSLRTKSHVLDPDKWIKDVFGQDQHGVFYGGGRKDKGGFQIPLGVFGKCSDRELLWILIKKTIDELFYNKIGVEDSESAGD
ncbi:MAG: bifunctional oligoribonuclease/PAP phosphatase NrnA [Pseudobacteriovorax sp.]|nr:bifunctional oligoribonuclease/PAP phosphatase NrnA [Pseudobacteriovorax sp.]